MEVVRKGSVPEEDATSAPIFYGGNVSRQPLVGADKSEYYNFGLVNFYGGPRTSSTPTPPTRSSS